MSEDTGFKHKKLSYQLVGCFYEVRNSFGNGHKELVYQNALEEVLGQKGLEYTREKNIYILSPHSGEKMGNYRLDFVVEDLVIVEAKALSFTPRKIENQLYSYLRCTPYEVGYLVNFGSTDLYFKRVLLTNDRKPYFEKVKDLEDTGWWG